MIHLQQRWGFALLFLIASIPLLAQGAPAVRQRNLVQLTQKSDTIIRGTVISAVVEKHPTLPHLATVLVKVRVVETLKGSPDDTFTFREFLWKARATQRDVPPHYQPGQELVLLMLAPSRYDLSSPAGLEQGVFRVSRDKFGTAYATNGRNNQDLLKDASEALASRPIKLDASTAAAIRANRPGPLRLDDLSAIIRQFVEVANAR